MNDEGLFMSVVKDEDLEFVAVKLENRDLGNVAGPDVTVKSEVVHHDIDPRVKFEIERDQEEDEVVEIGTSQNDMADYRNPALKGSAKRKSGPRRKTNAGSAEKNMLILHIEHKPAEEAGRNESTKEYGKDTRCEECHRFFKGVKGLAIHHVRSDCGKVTLKQGEQSFDSLQRLSVNDSNLESMTDLDKTHCTSQRYAVDIEKAKLNQIGGNPPINWPPAKDKRWTILDKNVRTQLPDHLPFDSRMAQLELVTYEEAKELFGSKEKAHYSGVRKPIRRQRLLGEVRKALKVAAENAKNASTDEIRKGHSDVVHKLKIQRRSLRRAENASKRRWRRKKQRSACYKKPFPASKELLHRRVHGKLRGTKEEVDTYVSGVALDADRETELGPLPGLPVCLPPRVPFNKKKFEFETLQSALRKKT